MNIFEQINELEEKLSNMKIDKFDIHKRRPNSRKATMGTDMFYEAKPEMIEAYKSKLEGKLDEYKNAKVEDSQSIQQTINANGTEAKSSQITIVRSYGKG